MDQLQKIVCNRAMSGCSNTIGLWVGGNQSKMDPIPMYRIYRPYSELALLLP